MADCFQRNSTTEEALTSESDATHIKYGRDAGSVNLSPESCMSELRDFCHAIERRANNDTGGESGYLKAWLAIITSIVEDEQAGRAKALSLLNGILSDPKTNLSASSRKRLSEVANFLH
jgi:hypothetical protein